MKEIVVLSGKGGAGKTTISASFNVLAKNNIAVDTDVEAANLQFLLRKDREISTKSMLGMKRAEIDPDTCVGCSACIDACRFHSINIVDDVHVVKKSSCEGCATCTLVCPVDAISMIPYEAGKIYQSTTEYNKTLFHANLNLGEENTGMLVSEVRRQAKEFAEENNLGWIIIDGPPGTGCPVSSAATGTNFVILAIEASVSGVSDFLKVLALVESFWIPRAVIINKYDFNPESTAAIEKKCIERHVPIIGKIPYDKAIQEALSDQEPIVLHAPESEGAKAIIEAWERFQEIVDKDPTDNYLMKFNVV